MAESEDQKSLISQFVNVSGVSEERAKFYLESASWNLEVALESLFDHIEVEDDAEDFQNEPRASSPPTSAEQQQSSSYSHPAPPPSSAQFPHNAAPPRFATIGSLRGQDDEDNSSDEEGQAFYAGGSEHGGGQQILGPSKKSSNKIVKDMFKAAKEHGAEEVEPSAGRSASAGRSQAFQGRAYRLGDSEATSEVINSSVTRLPDRPQVDMVLKLWQNGFSVDDGPLRDFTAPENRKFLDDIKNGEVPRELIQQARGGEVNLNLEDHRHEDYVKPRTAVRAFAGEGRRLGCPSDADHVAAAGVSTQPVAAAAPLPLATAAAVAPSASSFSSDSPHDFDASQPSTNIQIRLADGSRLAVKFNLSHHVSDIRQFVVTSRPQYALSDFILMTTFPSVELTDETQTISSAKLNNAVVVQRMK